MRAHLAGHDWGAALDGYNTPTVEQDGTFVHAGDTIGTSVSYAYGKFTLPVSGLTTGETSTTTAACSTCARASAEWVIERPALCNNALTKCFLTELADFGTSTMGGDEAQVTGGKVKGVAGFTNFPIDMVDPVSGGGFISLDTVSALNGKSFTATWDRSGNTVPITLGG